MMLAVKRLRKSDLSFFQVYFKKHKSAKQKGFNLDKSVLEGVFFPGLTVALQGRPKAAALVDLELSGPGGAAAVALARKVKIDAKNFRLNGEFIPDPVDDPRRYKAVEADDFVVMQFGGGVVPKSVRAVLISARKLADQALHAELLSWFPKGSMRVISARDIARISARANPAPNHPFRQWDDVALVEEAALGSTVDVEALDGARSGSRRKIDPADLLKARASAAKAGADGEKLLDMVLAAGRFPGARKYEWTSKSYPFSPYDFLIVDAKGKQRHVDAKSTAGAFENRIYISGAEIRHALSSKIPYDIVRLYQVSESKALFQIARDIAAALAPLRDTLEHMPDGVSFDSLSFDPAFFKFESKVRVV